MTTRYLRGDVVDQIFARIGAPGVAGELNWLLQDRQGSVREVRNASGGAIRNVDYDGFGNVLGTAPSELGRYTWTGRERDVEIDLQYNRARYYDPATGRWIHRDPLGFDAGDSNLYRYVNNGPTNGTDPSGLDHIDDDYERRLKNGSLVGKNGGVMTREQFRTAYEAYGPGGRFSQPDGTRVTSSRAPPTAQSRMPSNSAGLLQNQLQRLLPQLPSSTTTTTSAVALPAGASGSSTERASGASCGQPGELGRRDERQRCVPVFG